MEYSSQTQQFSELPAKLEQKQWDPVDHYLIITDTELGVYLCSQGSMLPVFYAPRFYISQVHCAHGSMFTWFCVPQLKDTKCVLYVLLKKYKYEKQKNGKISPWNHEDLGNIEPLEHKGRWRNLEPRNDITEL